MCGNLSTYGEELCASVGSLKVTFSVLKNFAYKSRLLFGPQNRQSRTRQKSTQYLAHEPQSSA